MSEGNEMPETEQEVEAAARAYRAKVIASGDSAELAAIDGMPDEFVAAIERGDMTEADRVARAQVVATIERWMVVDCHRSPIIVGMFRQVNAQQEADELNRTGLEEGRPYRVVRDVVAEST